MSADAAQILNSPLYPRYRILSPNRLEANCYGEGLPTPTYHWVITYTDGSVLMLNDSITLEDGRRVDISNTPFFGLIIHCLELSPSMASDSGNYSCVATNRLGSSVFGPTITVYGK